MRLGPTPLSALTVPSTGPGIARRAMQAVRANWHDALITCAGVAVLAYLGLGLARWAWFDSVAGTGPETCRAAAGACWSVIQARYRLILFGLYPYDAQWRSALACLIVIATVAIACVPRMWTASRMMSVWFGGYVLFFVFMLGGLPGLPLVLPAQWGGLALTLFIYVTVIAFGMPVAMVLALLRQDSYPAFRWLVAFAVDITRALPLLTILFSAAIVLPLLLPEAIQGDKLSRTLAGFVFFFACYQSEIIRGGFQAIPRGQREAGRSLGLGYWQVMRLVILPQAFRAAMPATISQMVITFKETSLVVIVGLFDLMASGDAAYQTAVWSPYYREVYAFVAVIYFAGAFALSRYGAFVERRFAVVSR